ncbi:NAD(P)-dependent oxidoreductase [Candidatus Parcubacteria bacterium]|nr:NAD(P)-dependent oxidoreductase [Candidatus Parcubacteria bacterium]
MKLLVTGATGFIGSHLIKRLVTDNHSVHVLVRPSTNTDTLKKENVTLHVFNDSVTDLISHMQTEHFDGVIHLASLFLAQHKSEDIKNLIDSNVYFSTAVLEASVKSSIPWFINTGTFWQHYNDAEYSPVNLYAATKQAFEDIAKYYTETSALNFVTIKLSDTFGPNDTRSKIFNLWLKISKSKEPLDMSPGEQILDMSFVDNVIEGYATMIELLNKDSEKKLKGKSFAITSNERMSLKKLAELFEQTTGFKLNINWSKKDYRPREVMIPWSKGQKIPGWKPLVSIKEGIKKLYE